MEFIRAPSVGRCGVPDLLDVNTDVLAQLRNRCSKRAWAE